MADTKEAPVVKGIVNSASHGPWQEDADIVGSTHTYQRFKPAVAEPDLERNFILGNFYFGLSLGLLAQAMLFWPFISRYFDGSITDFSSLDSHDAYHIAVYSALFSTVTAVITPPAVCCCAACSSCSRSKDGNEDAVLDTGLQNHFKVALSDACFTGLSVALNLIASAPINVASAAATYFLLRDTHLPWYVSLGLPPVIVFVVLATIYNMPAMTAACCPKVSGYFNRCCPSIFAGEWQNVTESDGQPPRPSSPTGAPTSPTISGY